MPDQPEPKKVLVLHIRVPGIWVDDLEETAKEFECSIGDLITDEYMRSEVGLTIVTLPDDKCLNDDFGVHAYTATIVGAEAQLIDGTGADGG